MKAERMGAPRRVWLPRMSARVSSGVAMCSSAMISGVFVSAS
jgi:hypothetical protein